MRAWRVMTGWHRFCLVMLWLNLAFLAVNCIRGFLGVPESWEVATLNGIAALLMLYSLERT